MDTATAQDLNAAMDGVDAAGVSASRAPARFSLVKLAMAAVAGLLLMASIACLILIQLGFPRLQGVVATDLIKPNREQVYTARLPHPPGWPGLFTFQTDGAEDARASTLQLFEDGVALGPPHAAHAAIAGSGGAYSHWGDVLYFSSTRGDDPRTSGREYRIISPYVPAPWILPTLWAVAVLSGLTLIVITVRRTAYSLMRSTFRFLGRAAPYAIYTATATGIVAMAVVSLVDFRQEQVLEPGGIRAEKGYAYRTTIPTTNNAIPFLVALRSGRDAASAPVVRLVEDGKEVGLPRSRAVLVQNVGAGRYNVNGPSFQFSTPDNSDPRTNGRTYAVQERLGLSADFNLGVVVLVAVSLVLLARRRTGLVLGGVGTVALMAGITGVLSYFDFITYDEYVSPAGVYHVFDNAYGFSVRGSVAPFVSAAPVGAPTAVGVGDDLVRCESLPTSVSALTMDGAGACSRRATGIDIDIVFPESAGEGAAPSFYRYPVRVHWYAIVGLFLIGTILIIALRFRPTALQALVGTGTFVGGVGALLMAANLSGAFFDLRAPMPTERVQGIRSETPRLSFDESVRRLTWRQTDNPESYAQRANRVVFESMIHGDVSTDLARWRLEIPVWENWSLHALGAVNPSLTKYRYWDHKKELERGIGICGDLSGVLIGYLVENGVPARAVGLNGHVVVTAEIRPGVWHIFDPDYGVVIPHSLEEVQDNPGLAEAAYRDATRADELQLIVGYYATAADNSIDKSGRDGSFMRPDGSADIYRDREQFMEWLKWVAPSLMLVIGLLIGLGSYLLRGRRREHSGQAVAPAAEPAAAGQA